MNRAKPLVTYLPKVRLRPELSHCPHCQTVLRDSHPVWAKPIYGLQEARFVTSLGYRCANADCAYSRTVYRSAEAESLSLKGSSYALEVVVHIGHLWLHEHRNRSEIHALLREQVPLSERHVQNLFESYLALLRCDRWPPCICPSWESSATCKNLSVWLWQTLCLVCRTLFVTFMCCARPLNRSLRPIGT